jgi:hypothetical protein
MRVACNRRLGHASSLRCCGSPLDAKPPSGGSPLLWSAAAAEDDPVVVLELLRVQRSADSRHSVLEFEILVDIRSHDYGVCSSSASCWFDERFVYVRPDFVGKLGHGAPFLNPLRRPLARLPDHDLPEPQSICVGSSDNPPACLRMAPSMSRNDPTTDPPDHTRIAKRHCYR